jgi:ketosteroid isomerase-like protein
MSNKPIRIASTSDAEPAEETTTETRRVTESYFDAENRRHIEDILDHFAEDVRFYGPDGALLEGHAAIREFYQDNAERMPELRVDLVSEVAQGSRAAVQWLAQGTGTDGGTVLMRGSNVVTVVDGRFIEFHAYWGLRSPDAEPL